MEIVSFIPGRVRIRLDGLYRNMSLAPALCKELYSNKNVYSIKINTYTAKLLIVYNKDNISYEDLLYCIDSCLRLIFESNKIDSNDKVEFENKSNMDSKDAHISVNKSISNWLLNKINMPMHFKPALFIFTGGILVLTSGQYSLLVYFLLSIFLYKTISTMFTTLFKEKLPKTSVGRPKEESMWGKLVSNNPASLFYDRTMPLIALIALVYSTIVGNLTILLSIIFLFIFNSLKKSTSLVLHLVSAEFNTHGISLINLSKLDKISNIDTVIIDKTTDTSYLEVSFVEHLREHGIWDIHLLTTDSKIIHQGKNLELKICTAKGFEVANYINSLKYNNKIVALITNGSKINDFFKDVDVNIHVADGTSNFDTDRWDLVIKENNCLALGEIFDYTKYAMEKIYQNQLISLWVNILGITLSFSNQIKLLYIGLICLSNEIAVYLNSLKLLSYEPIYV